MNIDDLIGRIIQRFNRQILSAPSSYGDVCLPEADPDYRYLLYLHVPYCFVLCPFCSFHRVAFDETAAQRYFRVLQREIDIVTDAGYRFDELYVGGGTPTVLPDELAALLGRVRERHALTGISIETNPDHLRLEKLERLKQAGVNRLSVGVQSFDDVLLRGMQRYEKYGSGSQIRDRLIAIEGVFDTLNVDMIFNLPNQSETSLKRDLAILTAEIGVDQVSFYPLMSDDTIRERMAKSMGHHDYGRERGYYALLTAHMTAAGYTRTSAWCFSRKPGMFDEYIVDREQYVGLGSGAFSYVDGALCASTFSIDEYVERIEAGDTGTVWRRDLDRRDEMRYLLLMRLFGGRLDKSSAERLFDGGFGRKLWPELTALKALGAIQEDSKTIRLTDSGYYLWSVLMREFFAGINSLRRQMRGRAGRVDQGAAGTPPAG